MIIERGTTSYIGHVWLPDSSSTVGAGKTGVAFDTASLKIALFRAGSATVTEYTGANIEDVTTIGTYQAPTAGKVRFKEVDASKFPGLYELHILNAWVDDSAAHRALLAIVHGAANVAPTPQRIQLIPVTGLSADVKGLNGDAAAAQNLARSASTIYYGTVGASPTATTLADAGLTQSDNEHWRGRVIIFLTGNLAKQGTDITGFTAATDTLTFKAVTQAPAPGDTYLIL